MMTKISVLLAALLCGSIPSHAVVIHSVCATGCDYPDPGAAEAALPSIVPTWPVLNDTYIFEWQAGQSFTATITVLSPSNGQAYFACKTTNGSQNVTCPKITDPASAFTVAAGQPVTGPGIPANTTVNSVSGTGPYTVLISNAATVTNNPEVNPVSTLYFGTAHWIVHRSSQCYSFPSGARAGPVNTTTGAGVYPGMAKLISPATIAAAIAATAAASYHRFECVEIASNTAAGEEPFSTVQLQYQPAGAPGSAINQLSGLVHHVIFDRDYIHHYVDSNGASRTAYTVIADAGYMELTNSVFMNFNTSNETHAFGGANIHGPLYIRNNEFETSQIGTLFGGGGPDIGGNKATGVQFLGNYYYTPWLWRVTSGTANPANTFYPSNCMYDSNGGESFINTTSGHWWLCVNGTWADQGVGTPTQPYCNSGACVYGNSTNLVCSTTAGSMTMTCNDTTGVQVGMSVAGPGPATFGIGAAVSQLVSNTTLTLSQPATFTVTGTAQFQTAAAGANGVQPYCTAGCTIDKNHWECKNCFGVLNDGNWIQNAWQPAMLGQDGECILLNQVDNSSPSDHAPEAVESYITFQNNRCDSNAQGVDVGSVGGPYSHLNADLTLRNNLFTNIGMPQLAGTSLIGYGAPGMMFVGNYARTVYDHNTLLLNNSVFGSMGYGALACNGGTAGFLAWASNIANTGYAGWYDGCDSQGPGQYVLKTDYPTSNFGHSAIITTQNPCTPGNGNCGQVQWGSAPCNGCSYPQSFSIFNNYPTDLTVASAYQGTGYVGLDPGADIPVVNWSTQGAVAGTPNPYLDFRVRALQVAGTSATFRYTAPDTGACTLTIANNSGYNSPVYSSSDSGGNPDRSVAVSGLSSNTRYWYKLVCGTSSYRRSQVFITNGA